MKAIKIIFKTLLALGVALGVLALLRYFTQQQADYIEIFNDDLDEGLFE